MNTAMAHPAGDASPFHAGEREVQTRAGVRDEAEKRGQRMLSADLNAQQRTFFSQLPFLVSAHTDDTGQPWAGLVTGAPGFLSIEEGSNACRLDWRAARNPTRVQVQDGSALGLLGIELATRRRNRLNGTVLGSGQDSWQIRIDQGYGNCPKYINERPWPAALFDRDHALSEQAGITPAAQALAQRTDTFFIATASGPARADGATQASAWGADISHRGGEPGFLQWVDGRLVFEDYPGNNMFNTLGNIARFPRCGLLMLDFEQGDIVQLATQAEIVYASEGRSIVLEVLATRHWRATGH